MLRLTALEPTTENHLILKQLCVPKVEFDPLRTI